MSVMYNEVARLQVRYLAKSKKTNEGKDQYHHKFRICKTRFYNRKAPFTSELETGLLRFSV